MSTVLLFDIDGTLVTTGGAGRRAMVRAIDELHGKADAFEGLSFAGMTDRAIARHGLAAALERIKDAEIDRFLEAYVAFLEEELATSAYAILPGVQALLASIHGTADVAIGLGTGNIKRGAYAKLGRGALDGAFGFGGFGCDAEERAEVLRAGAVRGAALLGRPLEECRVVVIGDTPKDVAAAKAIGAPCIAVGTGGYALAALEACGAERAFATLAEDGVREAILSERKRS